jgi:hypothetical protein
MFQFNANLKININPYSFLDIQFIMFLALLFLSLKLLTSLWNQIKPQT